VAAQATSILMQIEGDIFGPGLPRKDEGICRCDCEGKEHEGLYEYRGVDLHI
jgi:hypothetical protein